MRQLLIFLGQIQLVSRYYFIFIMLQYVPEIIRNVHHHYLGVIPIFLAIVSYSVLVLTVLVNKLYFLCSISFNIFHYLYIFNK